MYVYLLTVMDDADTFVLGVYSTMKGAERCVQSIVGENNWEIEDMKSSPSHAVFFIKDEPVSYEIARMEVES